MGIEHVVSFEVSLPVTLGQYKVVQFDVDGKPYMRFLALERGVLHCDIVEAFAKELGSCTFREGRDKVIPLDARIKIVGAGICIVGMKNYAMFGGRSEGYGLRINQEYLSKNVAPGWTFEYNSALL